MTVAGGLQEVENFLTDHPETLFVDVLISDLVGFPRGKRIEVSSLKKVFEQGINLPATIFSMNVLGEVVEDCGLGLDMGEPDMLCLPIADSLHFASWHDKPIAQVLMAMYSHDGKPFDCDPRHLLANVVEQLYAMGYVPVVAVELEFYLFDRLRDKNGKLQAPVSPMSGVRDSYTQVYSVDSINEYTDFLDEIHRICQEQGVPADTAVAESAPGQFEINLTHQSDALKACDNAVLLKRIVKAVGKKHGFDVSFMAKPYSNEAGSGLHLHTSLLDKDGNNVFAHEEKDFSDLLEFAVGGVLDLMPASIALLCPNINSYRRFQPGYYVAMHRTWGRDNRTVAVRIPRSRKEATRIEHRIAGADANPYLVMSVVLASIVHGLKGKIKPCVNETIGNAFAQDYDILPTRLETALNVLQQDNILTSYLGQRFVDNYVTAKRSELNQFESHVTDLEINWYLHNT